MIRKAITSASLLIAALLALAWLSPVATPVTRVQTPAPVAPSLPACITEDGAGMALCTWDAASQGNGKGRSVISGDCAPDIMGEAASAACVALHKAPSHTVTDVNGFESSWPTGADLVAECMDEDRAMTNEEKAENGFTILECFKAQMP